MDLAKLSSVIKNLNETVENSDKLLIPTLVVRAKKAAESFPNDGPIIRMFNILAEMDDNNKIFIKQAEFQNIYDTLYTPTSRLSEVYRNEVKTAEDLLPVPKYIEKDPYENASIEHDYSYVADPVLSNALASVFNGEPLRYYSEETAKSATKVCEAELKSISLPANKISVFSGRKDVILCAAEYTTPKGSATALIPVEIKQGKALFPNMFISKEGVSNLSRDLLENHLKSTAGRVFRVDTERVLDVLQKAKSGVTKIASDVQMAIIRKNSDKGVAHSLDSMSGFLLQPEPEQPIDISVQASVEDEAIAKKLATPAGEAGLVHGKDAVERGRHTIMRKLASFGHRQAQVTVDDYDQKKIYFAVSLGGKAGMRVPVKVASGRVSDPGVVFANGGIKQFTKESLDEILQSGIADLRAVAVNSPNFRATPTKLIETIKQAALIGDFDAAEDAMSVLAETAPEYKQIGLEIMRLAMSQKYDALQKKAEQEILDVPKMNHFQAFYPKGEE